MSHTKVFTHQYRTVVLHVLDLVEEAAIAVVQRCRQIPMEDRHHWDYVVSMALVHYIDVVLKSSIVDRIMSATKRNHSGPRDAEAISLGSEFLQ